MAANALQQFCHLEPMMEDMNENEWELEQEKFGGDALDKAFQPFLRHGFHSLGCVDRGSGTIFHFLSLRDAAAAASHGTWVTNNIERPQHRQPSMNFLSLLALTETCATAAAQDRNDCDFVMASIQESRDIIAREANQSVLNGVKLLGMQLFKKQISADHVTTLDSGLPLLMLPRSCDDIDAPQNSQEPRDPLAMPSKTKFKLREIVIPYDSEATYSNGSSLLQLLVQSNLSRPKTGLFQWTSAIQPSNGGVILRPLPLAKADLALPSPSFIFQCSSLDEVQSINAGSAAMVLHKVGCNSNAPGQLMVHHPNLHGIDVRYCQSTELSSSFAEAQESLMAGSLDDLQNVNVLVKGGNVSGVETTASKSNAQGSVDAVASRGTKVDAMNGLGDCWVEFRANVKRPLGFLQGKSKRKAIPRTAKAPDLPYE